MRTMMETENDGVSGIDTSEAGMGTRNQRSIPIPATPLPSTAPAFLLDLPRDRPGKSSEKSELHPAVGHSPILCWDKATWAWL